MNIKKVVFLLIGLSFFSAGLIFVLQKFFFIQEAFPSPVSPKEEKKFFLLKELTRFNIEVKEGPFWDEDKQGIEIFTKDGIKTIFSCEKNITEQVASLQLILKKSKMINGSEEKMRIIDLRSSSPYVSL